MLHQEISSLITRDLKHIWHPCSQMKDFEVFKPLIVQHAKGSYIYLRNGKKIIDATSSWWCKGLGHNHPRLQHALKKQMKQFEHVIFSNTTYEVIVELSEKLAALTPHLNKIMFASDGSSAVEIAMKMSIHARNILGDKQRTQFLALQNGYHGETALTLSVSDLNIYRDPYQPLLIHAHFIPPPYVQHMSDPLWHHCAPDWNKVEAYLTPFAESTTAVILEPILQAANGMKIYSQDFLRRLRDWTKKHNIHLIADEIMTGIGRTGKMLASEHANIEPDFLCLAKGLTAGWLPLSVTLTSDDIYQLFYADYAEGKSFLHSHTHSGNALAASIALEVLQIMEEEAICEQAIQLGHQMYEYMSAIAADTQKLSNVRGIGAVVAADLNVSDPLQRLGFKFFQKAVELGALMRPLGNTIYWCPPLNMKMHTLKELAEMTTEVLRGL